MNQNIIQRNNVKITGKGTTPLLFAHGFGCDQNMWRFVAPAFEEDFKVILFDYVGSGNSDVSAYSSDRYQSLEGYAKDVLEVIEALELEDVIFVGHSVSSMIGALAAIKKPGYFNRLVMMGPSPCYLNDPPDYYGGFEQETINELLELMQKNYIGWSQVMAPKMIPNQDNHEFTEELRDSFCSTDPVIAHEFAKATFLADNRDDLSQIPVPVLVIQCQLDTIAPVHVGKYVHKKVLESTYRELNAHGHCPHLSHPQKTINLMTDYFELITVSDEYQSHT